MKNKKLELRIVKALDGRISLMVIQEFYDEPHRFYHTWEHIENMLVSADKEGILTDDLILAILFHDIIYNPQSRMNEEDSADFFSQFFHNPEVRQAILETKTHKPTTHLSKTLCRLDLEILNADLPTFMRFEENIFKEYQYVDYKDYKVKRLEILKSLGVRDEYIRYVENRQPKIAVYAGSFNPFHKGHLNILEKAEAIFDKVIIAKGQNPDKPRVPFHPPSIIRNREIVEYKGLLTDFINSLGYDVVLIRGLRNATDLQFELTQYRYFQDFKEDIKIVSIFCDKEFEHISSTAIRQLNSLNKPHNYSLI